jgi:hypothetical protein
MNDKISFTRNCNATKLAIRKKVLNDFIMKDAHDKRTGESMESSGNA